MKLRSFSGVLFGLLLLSTLTAKAQKLYPCENYTASGDPIATSTTWVIKPTGGNVYLLYSQPSTITGSTIFLFIDRLKDGEYKVFDTKQVTSVESGKNWFVYDYKFTQAGSYKIRVVGPGNVTWATEYVTVTLKSGENSPKLSSEYYLGSEIVFCEDVQSGVPISRASTFNISRQGSYVMVFVKHKKPLNTSKLIVDLYKLEGSEYKFVETKKYDIQSEWDWTNMKYNFYTPGQYRLSVYSGDQVLINDGYVTIKYK